MNNFSYALSYVLLLFSFQVFSFELPQFKYSELSEFQKIQLVSTLKHFHETESKFSERKYSFQSVNEDRIPRFWGGFSIVTEAFAVRAEYNCLYAGWGSKLINGSCVRPSSLKDSSYQQGECKGEAELQCNPALFGKGICIDISTQKSRSNAFLNCEKKFKSSGKTLDNLISEVTEEEFQEAVQLAGDICNNKSLRQSREQMCSVIKEKFKQFIPQKTSSAYPQAKKALASENTDEMAKALDSLVSSIKQNGKTLEEKCSTNTIKFQDRVICESAAEQLLSDQIVAQKLSNKLGVQLKTSTFGCDEKDSSMTPAAGLAADIGQATAEHCTEDEIKVKKSSCGEEISCAAYSTLLTVVGTGLLSWSGMSGKMSSGKDCISNENNCLVHLFTSLASYLISSIKSVYALLEMGYDWAKEKGEEFWTWLWEAEDETSKAQQNIQHLSQQDIKAIEEDSAGWFTKTLTGIGDMLNEWMRTEVFCEKWSGVPNFSTCEKPMTSWDCVGCGTMISGMCQMAGPIVGLIGETVLTGGVSAALTKGAKGAKAAIMAMKASPKYASAMKSVQSSSFAAKMSVAKAAVINSSRAPVEAVIRLSDEALTAMAKAATTGYETISKSSYVARAGEVLSKLKQSAPARVVKAASDLDDAAFKLGYEAVDGTIDRAASAVTKASRTERVVDTVNPEVTTVSSATRVERSGASIPGLERKVGQLTQRESEIALDVLSSDAKASILELGLAPKTSYLAPDGTQILLSEKYSLGGREAVMAYVIKDGKAYQRTIYKSNSQGVFRWTDGILPTHFSKGIGEEFMVLPPDLQKQLLTMEMPHEMKQIQTYKIAEIEMKNDDFRSLEEFKKAGFVEGVFEKYPATAPSPKVEYYSNDYYKTKDPQPGQKMRKRSYDEPSQIRLSKPELNPDFSRPIENYQITTATSGKVDVEIFKSRDGSLSYTLLRDSEGKVWVGDVYANSSELNKFGIPKSQPGLGNLTSPRWDYDIQVHPDFASGIVNPRYSEYTSNWNYVREIPLIQDYYKSKGIPIPSKE